MTDEEVNDFARGRAIGQAGGHPDMTNESQMAGWQAARNEELSASYTAPRPASPGTWESTPPPFLNTGTSSGSSDDTSKFLIFLFLAIVGLGGGKWGYDFAHKHYWEDFVVWVSATGGAIGAVLGCVGIFYLIKLIFTGIYLALTAIFKAIIWCVVKFWYVLILGALALTWWAYAAA